MTVHLTIKGEVQGVFYRASAKTEAERLNIKGWVKNTNKGHVEIVASGSIEDVDEFINWCRVGPPKAVVTEVTVGRTEDAAFEKFSIVR